MRRPVAQGPVASAGDTTGVFQLESSGFREILQKLKPDQLEDIVAAVALYRPGPLEGGMVDDFIERKHGRKAVEYLHPSFETILKDTLKRLSRTGDPEKQQRWRLYGYWVQWLQDTFSRPHECRLLRFTDVREFRVEGKTAIQFYTRPETKTGERLVYATSNVKGNLLRLYETWRLPITPEFRGDW